MLLDFYILRNNKQVIEDKGQAHGSVVTSMATITRWQLSALNDFPSYRNFVQRKLKQLKT